MMFLILTKVQVVCLCAESLKLLKRRHESIDAFIISAIGLKAVGRLIVHSQFSNSIKTEIKLTIAYVYLYCSKLILQA